MTGHDPTSVLPMGRRDESAIASGTNGSTRTPGLVAVVSDDSAAPAAVTGSKRQTFAGMLRGEAEVITRLSGLTVINKPVGTADDAAKLIEAVREMGAVGAIFLPGVEADRAQRTQRAVADWAGPAALTDQDATAIAVAASLLARIIDMQAYHRCMLTLVAATPPGRLLPEPDPNLALAIADTAAAGLRQRHRSAAQHPGTTRGLG